MKLGAQVVAYNQEFLLEYSLRSIYSACDVIHVTASQRPWNYVPRAAKYDQPDRTFEILDNFPDPENKLRIEKGYWSTEEEQRNHSAQVLRDEGCDYVFIVDPDEVYADRHLVKVRQMIDGSDTATVKHRIFWRDFNWRLTPDVVAKTFYRLHDDLHFRRGRLITADRRVRHTDIACHHFSYAMTPERMKEKLDTFMHAPQIKDAWYQNVWLNWKPEDQNLHPVDPQVWTRAERYPLEKLPAVLKTHPWYGKDTR